MNRVLPLVLLTGLILLYPLQRWIDSTMPREAVGEEVLYLSSGEQVKRLSLGLHGIVADIYWIRTVQYFGQRLLESGPEISADTSKIKMDLLAPLLKIVVALDPQNTSAYRFGAIFLPERDLPAAIELLETGIRNNPDAWRLYQDIGYIYWQAGDYSKAAEWFERGGELEGSLWWMRDLAGIMKLKGGSRDVARRIYSQYAESEDANIRYQASLRLRQLRMLDDIDAINDVLAKHKAQTGSCPENLRALAARLLAAGLALNSEALPVDPHNFPYQFDPASCTVIQNPASNVPRS
ncbi:MAG TPA: hypothetical protein VG778_09420 [Blastocatellia bacterium]|jgi:tetratricopeptide (TPR) repeat protein|nr:hypothetical protein [Blastocatellia bacterium]